MKRRAGTGVGAIVTACALAACARFSSGETADVTPTEPPDGGGTSIAPPPGASRCADTPARAPTFVDHRLAPTVLGRRRDKGSARVASLVGASGGSAYVALTEGARTWLTAWRGPGPDASEPVLVSSSGAPLHIRVSADGAVTAFDSSRLDRVSPSGARSLLVQFAVAGDANRATTGASLAFVTALPSVGGGTTEIRAYPLSKSSKASDDPVSLVSDEDSPRTLIAVGDRPVWLSETAPRSFVVKTVVEGEVTQVSSSLTLEALAADAHYAFALTTVEQSARLVRASLDGHGEVDLVRIDSATSQQGIAVIGDSVYFTANWGTVGLFRVPRCGGNVERLDVLGSATGPIFVDGRELYVENADEIRRYELP